MSSQPGRLSAFGFADGDEPGPADDIFAKDLGAADADSPAPDPEPQGETPEPALDAATESADATQTPPEGDAGQEAVSPDDPTSGEEPEEKLYAGKYRTAEDLEKGYRESSREAQAARQAAIQAQRDLADLQQAVQAYVAEQQAKPAAPAAPSDPTDAELAQMGLDRQTYNAVKPIIESAVKAQVDPILTQTQQQQQLAQQQLEQQRAQAEQSAAAANVQAVLGAFYQANADYAPGTDGNAQLGELISDWNQAWTGDPSGASPGSFDVSDAASLEIAVEAAKRPALKRILEANPTWFDSDAGMELARSQASYQEGLARAQRQQPAAKNGQALPQVESGASGSGPRQLDAQPRTPIEQMLADAEAERGQSVFTRG